MVRLVTLASRGTMTTTARMGWHLLMVKEKNPLTTVKTMNQGWFQPPKKSLLASGKIRPPSKSRLDPLLWERNKKIWERAKGLRINFDGSRERWVKALVFSISILDPPLSLEPKPLEFETVELVE